MPDGIFGSDRFSVTGAAQLVRASEGTIKGEIRAGRLKATSMPGNRMFWVIERSDLVAWYESLATGRDLRDIRITKEIREVCRTIGVELPTFSKTAAPSEEVTPANEPKQRVKI